MFTDGFRFVDTRHEQAAADMANAYGRIAGSPGVTLFITPGHVNCISGRRYHVAAAEPAGAAGETGGAGAAAPAASAPLPRRAGACVDGSGGSCLARVR